MDTTVQIRLRQNTFVGGVPYLQGDIASVTPKDAAALIACRAGEPFTPPEKISATVETAAVPITAVESAVIKTAHKPSKK